MPEIKWQAPEFEYHQKDISWYWLVAIIGIILAAIGLWQNNFLFVAFIIIAAIMVIFWGRQQPEIIEYKLDDKELHINEKLYDLKIYEGFCIDENTLILKNKNRFISYLKIQIKDQEKIKKHLQSIMPEIECEGSLTETLAQWLRF